MKGKALAGHTSALAEGFELHRHPKTSRDMAAIKDIVEGSFLRANEWSTWLLRHYAHEFKATRRFFNSLLGILSAGT